MLVTLVYLAMQMRQSITAGNNYADYQVLIDARGGTYGGSDLTIVVMGRIRIFVWVFGTALKLWCLFGRSALVPSKR